MEYNPETFFEDERFATATFDPSYIPPALNQETLFVFVAVTGSILLIFLVIFPALDFYIFGKDNYYSTLNLIYIIGGALLIGGGSAYTYYMVRN